ncbi:hypothetical protein [Arcanobacterium hippocoleae]|uniref:hypothetical protein n=1 Tax=Arcanobacterium hippocoleae TaxID=149017 RepID=UPI0033414AFE
MLMLDALPQGYIVVDADGEILRAAQLAKAFGFIIEDVLRPNIAEMVREVFSTGKTRDVEFDLVETLKRERRSRRIWARITRVNAERVIIFFEDQTEKRRLDETRRDFIANISHELKTPIGGLSCLPRRSRKYRKSHNSCKNLREIWRSNRHAWLSWCRKLFNFRGCRRQMHFQTRRLFRLTELWMKRWRGSK